MPPPPLVEVCVEGIDGVVAALAGGAQRIELCASLLEGGLTPSLGTVRAAVAHAGDVPVFVMVRPRGGDFLYSELEYSSMLLDVTLIRTQTRAAGVVFGFLTASGEVDESRTRALVGAARPLLCTVHRAFDMARDASEALEALVRCDVDRVLSSGQKNTFLEGQRLLELLVSQADGRIVVLGCGALDEQSMAVAARSTLTELHFAALKDVNSGMLWRNGAVGMGGTKLDREYLCTNVTDEAQVRRLINIAHGK